MGLIPGIDAMDVQHVTLNGKTLVYFKRLQDNAMERVTVIDRRLNRIEYPAIHETPIGLFVERVGYFPKLILWHNIEDLDVAPPPPKAQPLPAQTLQGHAVAGSQASATASTKR